MKFLNLLKYRVFGKNEKKTKLFLKFLNNSQKKNKIVTHMLEI